MTGWPRTERPSLPAVGLPQWQAGRSGLVDFGYAGEDFAFDCGEGGGCATVK